MKCLKSYLGIYPGCHKAVAWRRYPQGIDIFLTSAFHSYVVFSNIFSFSPLVGEMIQFDSYDPDGWPNHQDPVNFLRKSQTITVWMLFYTGCKPMGYMLDGIGPPLPRMQSWQNEGSGRDPLLENLRIRVGDLFEKNPSHLPGEKIHALPLWSCRPQVDCPNGMWVAWPLRRLIWGLIGSFFFGFGGGKGWRMEDFYHVFFGTNSVCKCNWWCMLV